LILEFAPLEETEDIKEIPLFLDNKSIVSASSALLIALLADEIEERTISY